MDRDSSDGGKKSPDLIKKLITAGLGAAFMTEEHIRNYLGDLKLPKDVLSPLIQGAAKSKEELVNRVGGELIKIVKRIDFVQEASRFVEEHRFRVTAEIDVIKKDSSDNLERRDQSTDPKST